MTRLHDEPAIDARSDQPILIGEGRRPPETARMPACANGHGRGHYERLVDDRRCRLSVQACHSALYPA
jgi:hypothetical protein